MFYEWTSVFPELQRFLPHLDEIQREVEESTTVWEDWPERYLYSEQASWKVIPFCATFPGNDPSATKWNQYFIDKFPLTHGLVKSIPNLRTAGFSKLGPHTSLHLHRGWAKLSNHVLRCHLPIQVPNGDILCGVICDNKVEFHKRGEWTVFDDSKQHKAFNHSDQERVVLLLDIARPTGVPLGTSTVEMSTELCTFLDSFR